MVWKHTGTTEQTDYYDKLLNKEYKSEVSKQSEVGFKNYKILKQLCTQKRIYMVGHLFRLLVHVHTLKVFLSLPKFINTIKCEISTNVKIVERKPDRPVWKVLLSGTFKSYKKYWQKSEGN